MKRNYFHPPVIQKVYDRYNKASETQDASIHINVYYGGRRKVMSTYVRVFPREWSEKLKAIVNRPDAHELNQQIEIMVLNIRKVLTEMMEAGDVDIFAIPQRLAQKQSKKMGLHEFMEKRAEVRKYGRKEDTQQSYDRFFRFFKEFAKITRFEDVTEEKIKEFDEWLIKRKLKPYSRWNNYHRFLTHRYLWSHA